MIAERTGAAVALIDHVTKDAESRGRFAIGGQAKLSSLTGAGYSVEVVEALGRGLRGVIVVRVGKDRPGSVRPHCGAFRKSDRSQEAARIVIDSTDPDNPVVTVGPPRTASHGGAEGGAAFRPTALMEKVSRAVEATPKISRRAIFDAVKGRQEYVGAAIDILTAEQHVTVQDGRRNARLHTSVKPYRQTDDPRSDGYEDRETVIVSNPLSTVSDPYTGDRETVTQLLPETLGRQSGDSEDDLDSKVSDVTPAHPVACQQEDPAGASDASDASVESGQSQVRIARPFGLPPGFRGHSEAVVS